MLLLFLLYPITTSTPNFSFSLLVIRFMETSPLLGRVHSVETFGSVDGPGIRFLIFLKGCSMRCRYCHNPDTWDPETDDLRTADELLTQAMRYRSYWGREGGITVSGGEALLQIDFLTELFRKAKAKGIHTCLDTSGQPFTRREPFFSKFAELMKYTDLLLFDLKQIDDAKHRELTGRTNRNILDCARYLSDIGKPIWVRHVLVPGVTDNDDDLHALRAFIDTLQNVKRVEVLPYHAMGTYKWEQLGIPYTLKDVSAPSEERVRNAEHILTAPGICPVERGA
jgi:pyruvate formate-lyase 1-activating enzyme